LKSTKSHYFDGTNYFPHRKALHNEIIQYFLEDSQKNGDEPIAFLLGGGSASGKSTYGEHQEEILNNMNKFPVYIDSDLIKEKIPEYSSLKITNPLEAADIVHDESSDVAKELLERAIQESYDIIFDGTMKNEEKYISLISKLKEKGYEVFAIIVDVPIEHAFKMADMRFEIEGRLVSKKTILETHIGVSRTFNKIKEMFDGYVLWDNSKYGEEGTIFAEKNEEGEWIKDENRLQQFYQKANHILEID